MRKSDLSGQIALITGATGGIGTSLCRLLASHGCSVAIHYNSDEDTALELLDEFKEAYVHEYGSKFVKYKADMGNYEETGVYSGFEIIGTNDDILNDTSKVREMYEHVIDIVGPPTILINNAGANGGLSRVKSIDEVSVDDFENTWRINCGSAYLLTQLCMPAMEGEGWGRVIFISSVAGFTGGVVGPHYASSKSALHGLVHWLAGAYAKKGITVNGVAPALIEQTKMLPGSTEELSSKIPIGRLGLPDEVAETVLWMVKTSYVTNKVVAVDGGMFPQ